MLLLFYDWSYSIVVLVQLTWSHISVRVIYISTYKPPDLHCITLYNINVSSSIWLVSRGCACQKMWPWYIYRVICFEGRLWLFYLPQRILYYATIFSDQGLLFKANYLWSKDKNTQLLNIIISLNVRNQGNKTNLTFHSTHKIRTSLCNDWYTTACS